MEHRSSSEEAAMCRVKGCSRPQFVGGTCGFHALQGYYRAAPRRTWRGPERRSPRPAAKPAPASAGG
ncbi:MAG: hypothetical protein HZB56_06050 [Deltaproteobacteria bacterium]|nr:hypothetical protein [Deltaproteobacteria bacterium]